MTSFYYSIHFLFLNLVQYKVDRLKTCHNKFHAPTTHWACFPDYAPRAQLDSKHLSRSNLDSKHPSKPKFIPETHSQGQIHRPLFLPSSSFYLFFYFYHKRNERNNNGSTISLKLKGISKKTNKLTI